MSATKSKEIIKVYDALSHPLRKRIVEIIGEKKLAGFKDLKDMLNVSVGTLYYHLDVLEDLITQNEERKYVLTNKGKFALGLLSSSEEQLKATGIALKAKEPSIFSSFIREIAFGRRMFISVTSNPLRYIPEVLMIVGFGAWIFAETRIEPIMMFYNNQPTWPSSMIIIAEFVASWVIIFGLCEILSIIFFRRFGGEMNLLVGTAFSLVPMLILPAVLYANNLLNLGLRVNWLWINVFLLIFQAWILCLLTAAVGFSKGLRMEKAALISLTVMYFNVVFLVLFIRGL